MPIKISTYGGIIGWYARKIIPRFSYEIFAKLKFKLNRKETLAYIDDFLKKTPAPKPLAIGIETINRCNGTCGFCPCNVKAESRPLKKMTEETFRSIIKDLVSWDFKGCLIFNINNEPFLDNRAADLIKYAREHLPECYFYVITNGTLLTLDLFKQIAPFMDKININNYSRKMRLHKNIQEIANYVNANPTDFKHIEIDIQYRYLKEVLSNRNGSSPNKPAKNPINEPCLEPFTVMNIFPDGVVGLCCFDALEKTNMGILDGGATLAEIWSSDAFNKARASMKTSRAGYDFCKYCDGFSKDIRTQLKG